MNGTSDIDTTRFQRAAVVRQNGARIAAQVVKEAQQACLWVGEDGEMSLSTHASKTVPMRRNVVVRGLNAYCDNADAMSNASVHIPSNRAGERKGKARGGAAVR
ncbi:MAG: hypothetical protein WCH20_01905 [Nitrospira sp.]